MQRAVLAAGFIIVFLVGYWVGQEQGPACHALPESEKPSALAAPARYDDKMANDNGGSDQSVPSPAVALSDPLGSEIPAPFMQAEDTEEMDSAVNETSGQVEDLSAQQHEYDHQNARKAFNRAFSEEMQDFDKEVKVKDFFFLHEQAANIELHKVLCATDKCQVIGMYDGDHKGWETVVDDLKQSDWWDFTGTSSSSNTRDGVTYFNIFFDKQP